MNFPCPPPEDREAWRQWTKCYTIGAGIALAVFGVIIFFLR